MTHFRDYTPEKYSSPEFEKIEEGIYRTKDPYGMVTANGGMVYVTSLSFQMEPEQYGEEDGSPRNITQVPFEELLDDHMLFITDFYEDLNEASEVTCYQEFGATDIEDIRGLREIIGKRYYAVPYTVTRADGTEEEYYRTVTEDE